MGRRNGIWGIGQVWNALAMGVIAGGLFALAGGAGAADSVVDPSDTPIFLPDPPQSGTVCSDSDNGDDFTYALPGPAVTQDEKSAWVARFVVPEWKGQLRRVDIADDTQDKTHSIPQPDSREIITFSPVEGAGVPFRWDSLTSEQQTALKGDDSQDDPGQGNPGEGNKSTGELRLEYLRGSHAEEQRNGGDFRNRETWVLGDTVHSKPVIVGTPPYLYPDEGLGSDGSRYSDFREANADREPLVFVGANDGMLHAFYSKDPDGDGGLEAGEEAFAYVPGERFREAVAGGGLIFAYGSDQQLGSLVQEDGENWLKDLPDSRGNKDTKHVDVVGPTGDFDGDGTEAAVYMKTQSQIRVMEVGSGTASTKIPLGGDKAHTSKSRLAVGSFSGDDSKIWYVEENKDMIMSVAYGNGGWQNPQVAADVSDNEGAQAISGFGDIDGDGRKELVYADGSQDPHFLEKCDIRANLSCGDGVAPGARRFYKPGGTPGSNNDIGYGNLFDYPGDDRDTKGLLFTDGSNNVWIAYPKEPGNSDNQGARYAPNTPDPEPHTKVEKGTQITDCDNKQGQDHCAAKSPLAAIDVDGDGELEVAFPGNDASNHLASLRVADGLGDGEVSVSELSSMNYNPVKVDDRTGVTGGDVGGGGGTGSAIYDQLPKLTKPDYSHRYFIDGSPTYADAYFSDKGEWRSVVVTPFGRGDYQGIFALDVTKVSEWATDGGTDIEDDKASDIPLWQFGDTEHNGVGHVVNKVSIVRLNNGDWAVAFGNGFGNRKDDGHQSPTGDAQLLLVDVETGELIRTISTKEGADEDPTTADRGNALGPVAPVDTDGDAIADYIYAGDLFGNLWKFDLTSSNSDDWHIVDNRGTNQAGQDPKTPLFTAESDAGNPQPITVRPVVDYHPAGSKSGLMIYFGTGKYIESGDHSQTNETTQSLYGLWDPLDNSSTSYDRDSDLLEQEIELEKSKTVDGESFDVRVVTDNAIDWTEHNGWYLDLIEGSSNDGERLVASPQLINGELLFNTMIPRVPRECGETNEGWLIKLEAANGSRTQAIPFDLDGDSSFGEAERVKVDGKSKHISGAKTQTGSSTGGVGVYLVPNSGSQSVKSQHPGGGVPEQGLDTRQQNTPGGATGRQYWQQLR